MLATKGDLAEAVPANSLTDENKTLQNFERSKRLSRSLALLWYLATASVPLR